MSGLTDAEREQWDVDPDQWPHTPPLHVFRALMDEDDNLWWRAGSGHGLNAYEAAIEALDAARTDDGEPDCAGPEIDRDLCAEHRGGKPGQPHEWRRGRRGRTRLVTCNPQVTDRGAARPLNPLIAAVILGALFLALLAINPGWGEAWARVGGGQ